MYLITLTPLKLHLAVKIIFTRKPKNNFQPTTFRVFTSTDAFNSHQNCSENRSSAFVEISHSANNLRYSSLKRLRVTRMEIVLKVRNRVGCLIVV